MLQETAAMASVTRMLGASIWRIVVFGCFLFKETCTLELVFVPGNGIDCSLSPSVLLCHEGGTPYNYTPQTGPTL